MARALRETLETILVVDDTDVVLNIVVEILKTRISVFFGPAV